MQGVLSTTIEALGRRVMSAAEWTSRACFKWVKELLALSASPINSSRRRGLTSRTRVALTPTELCDLEQGARVLKPGPAIHQDKNCQGREPPGSENECESYESQHANKAQNCRDHEAASSPQNKPEERSQNLTAVERVNRKEIENE